ncbi:MAG: hypothetical protein ACE5FC_09255 [Myxococcota bacterium]
MALAAAAALLALSFFAAACRAPELRALPARSPIHVDGRRLPTIGLVAYADSVKPESVSDGSFCPHADRALFRRFFAAPEEVLEEELARQGYPVTAISTALAPAYATRVRVSHVGESACARRVPLFGPQQAEDCSVRLRITVTGEGTGGRVKREFERTGESSILEQVDAYQDGGPTRAWREALRDAVRQILSDPAAAGMLTGGLAR